MSFEIFCETWGGVTSIRTDLGGAASLKHIKALESTELGSIWTRIVLGWNGTQKDREKKKVREG